jgi:hypothetical protein
MAPIPKTPSFLPELKAFTANLKDVPYDKLMSSAQEAGWDYQLQQTEIVGLADSSVMVTFQVLIGRAGEARYEPFDMVTQRLPAAPGAVSLAARLALEPTLIWLFFGRLPPVTAQGATAAPQTVNVAEQPEGDIVLPADEQPDEQEYVTESAPISRRAAAQAAKLPDLVDHLEPDGVPVFVDLDSLPEEFTSAEIFEQFLADIDAAAVKFSTPEQVLALFTKNTEAIDFLKELGSTEDKSRLKDMLDAHQARLTANNTKRETRIPGGKGSAEAASPRRRRAA